MRFWKLDCLRLSICGLRQGDQGNLDFPRDEIKEALECCAVPWMGGSLSVDRQLMVRRVCGVAEPSAKFNWVVFSLVPLKRSTLRAVRLVNIQLMPF